VVEVVRVGEGSGLRAALVDAPFKGDLVGLHNSLHCAFKRRERTMPWSCRRRGGAPWSPWPPSRRHLHPLHRASIAHSLTANERVSTSMLGSGAMAPVDRGRRSHGVVALLPAGSQAGGRWKGPLRVCGPLAGQ
jgi:hypothetical protein